jgi:hypothetical protein
MMENFFLGLTLIATGLIMIMAAVALGLAAIQWIIDRQE